MRHFPVCAALLALLASADALAVSKEAYRAAVQRGVQSALRKSDRAKAAEIAARFSTDLATIQQAARDRAPPAEQAAAPADGVRLCVPLGDCMALVFSPPSASSTTPHPTVAVAFKCDGFALLVRQAANAQQPSGTTWDGSLDAEPAVASLRGSSKPVPSRDRRARQAAGAGVTAREGLGGGIADALALLPDLGLGATAAGGRRVLGRR